MITSSVPMGAQESTAMREIWLRLRPRRAPNANMATSVATSSAVNGCPKNAAIDFPGQLAAPMIEAAKISSTGIRRINATSATGGEVVLWLAGRSAGGRIAMAGGGEETRAARPPPPVQPPPNTHPGRQAAT